MAGAGLLLPWERVRTYPFLRTFPVLGAKNAEREASHSWVGSLTSCWQIIVSVCAMELRIVPPPPKWLVRRIK